MYDLLLFCFQSNMDAGCLMCSFLHVSLHYVVLMIFQLVHSIVSPLSTTSPRIKSVLPVVNSVNSCLIQQSSVAETGKGRYNSIPLSSRARDLVRNAVSARNKAKEAVDCNDNLVALKVPGESASQSSLPRSSLVNNKSNDGEKSCAEVKNNSVPLQKRETPKHTYNRSDLSHRDAVALVNGNSMETTPFNDEETNVDSASESGSSTTTFQTGLCGFATPVTCPEDASVLLASCSAKFDINERTEKSSGKMELASSKTDIENERTTIAECLREYHSSHDAVVGDKQISQSPLTCSEMPLTDSIPLLISNRYSENSSEAISCDVPNKKTLCLQPNSSAVDTLIARANESSVTSPQSSAVAANDVHSALLVLKSNNSSSMGTFSHGQPRLSGSAATCYSSISSRLYGSLFENCAGPSIHLSSPPMLNSPKFPVSSSEPLAAKSDFVQKPVSEPTVIGFLSAEDIEAVEGNDFIDSENSSDNSFNSNEEDVRDFHDSDGDSTEEAGKEDSTDKDGGNFRHNDSFATRELKHWHFRAVASPPPRRYPFHKPDDTVSMKASAEIDSDDMAEQCANVQRASKRSRRVTFDPFTLSLNAALEGELETLQATFVQVSCTSSL